MCGSYVRASTAAGCTSDVSVGICTAPGTFIISLHHFLTVVKEHVYARFWHILIEAIGNTYDPQGVNLALCAYTFQIPSQLYTEFESTLS